MIYTEITPNPASLKFVTDQVIMRRGSADFPNREAAENAPLALKLFDFDFVEAVFFGSNFVTVIKTDNYKWEEVIPAVKKLIQSFIDNGIEFIHQEANDDLPEMDAEEETEVVRRIKQLLNDNVRPAVAMDGGDVVFDSFTEGVVKLKLQGSCSGCPSSTMTLKMGIEGLLTRMVPEVQSVEAVDA